MINSTARLEVTNSTFRSNYASFGGALFVSGSATLEISQNSFFLFNNVARGGNGGAIYCTSKTICKVSQSTLISNSAASGLGGAIFANNNVRVFSSNNLYANNTATYAGAYKAADSSVGVFEYDRYERNSAINNGGVTELTGSSNGTWRFCSFYQNTAASTETILVRGGQSVVVESCSFEAEGIYKGQKGLFGAQAANIVIRNSTFTKGASIEGGAIRVAGSIRSILVEDCVFTDNSAFDRGAVSISGLEIGLPSDQVNVTLRRCRFEKNRAISSGGAVGGQGKDSNFYMLFDKCQFSSNEAGLYGGAGYFSAAGLAEFRDCSFDSNRPIKLVELWE